MTNMKGPVFTIGMLFFYAMMLAIFVGPAQLEQPDWIAMQSSIEFSGATIDELQKRLDTVNAEICQLTAQLGCTDVCNSAAAIGMFEMNFRHCVDQCFESPLSNSCGTR